MGTGTRRYFKLDRTVDRTVLKSTEVYSVPCPRSRSWRDRPVRSSWVRWLRRSLINPQQSPDSAEHVPGTSMIWPLQIAVSTLYNR